MRALQVRQPFQFADSENEVFLTFSTLDYEQILLRLAIQNEGAAEGVLVDYKNPSQSDEFQTTLITSEHTISDVYSTIEVNMNQVVQANNADSLTIRIRFTGSNMSEDGGDRVTINNISISGIKIPEPNEEDAEVEEIAFSLYPNPATNQLMISSNKPLTHVELYDVSGKFASRYENIGNDWLDVSELSAGLYFVKIYLLEGQMQTSRFLKIK
jgi:hypothetical protein